LFDLLTATGLIAAIIGVVTVTILAVVDATLHIKDALEDGGSDDILESLRDINAYRIEMMMKTLKDDESEGKE
jgi:hypothetical protein